MFKACVLTVWCIWDGLYTQNVHMTTQYQIGMNYSIYHIKHFFSFQMINYKKKKSLIDDALSSSECGFLSKIIQFLQ